MKVRRDDIGVFAQCRPLKPCKITKFERQLQTMAACMQGNRIKIEKYFETRSA